jgi:predicted Zn-dependent protease
MRSFVAACLDAADAAGASYADVRVVDTRTQSLSVRTGRVEAVSSGASFGFGVRVIADGAWGFASSSIVDPAAGYMVGPVRGRPLQGLHRDQARDPARRGFGPAR